MREVSVTTKSGIKFNGYLSESTNKKVIVIHVHGMQGYPNKDEFISVMHDFYPNNEVAFLAIKHRGTGVITKFECGNKVIQVGGALERFEDCIEDIQAWISFAKKIGYSQIWLQAHSLGTPKIVYYQNSVKSEVKGLILLSPSEMIGLVHDEIGQRDYDVMYPEAKLLVSYGKEDQILSHKLWGENPMSAGTFLNLFDTNSNAAIFNYANEDLGWNAVNKINIPVLAITGTKDDGIVSVMEAQKAMDKLALELTHSPRKKTIVYEGAEHHFRGYEDNIVSDVINFVKS